MERPLRVLAIAMIYGAVSLAWLLLGGVTEHRSNTIDPGERQEVEGLWGGAHRQQPPIIKTRVQPTKNGEPLTPDAVAFDPTSSQINVDIALDQRLKGLRWFALYDVTFDGTWDLELEGDGPYDLQFALPSSSAIYDDFRLSINDEELAVAPQNGQIVVPLPNGLRDVQVGLHYKSRGLDHWQYVQNSGGGALRDFSLRMTTNFDAIEFPEEALSPSSRTESANGTTLEWKFSNIITNRGIGMVMPQRIQPGELASKLAFTAPLSLFFFFLVIAILAKLEKLDVHPINYMFLAASFFSFHLLFAYTVDLLPLGPAFALASIVSVGMVTTYLRLVVSARFGFLKAGLAQLLYLVGFSAAHFLDGLTGLTVTVLSIATLFGMMLLTGRIKWSEVLAKSEPTKSDQGPYRTSTPANAES